MSPSTLRLEPSARVPFPAMSPWLPCLLAASASICSVSMSMLWRLLMAGNGWWSAPDCVPCCWLLAPACWVAAGAALLGAWLSMSAVGSEPRPASYTADGRNPAECAAETKHDEPAISKIAVKQHTDSVDGPAPGLPLIDSVTLSVLLEGV